MGNNFIALVTIEALMKFTDKKISVFKAIYYIVANTLIIFSIIVVCAHMFLKRESISTIDNFAQNFSKERRAAYGHMSDQDVNELLNATWNPTIGGWDYEDTVGFKEAPRKTKFVNVNELGLRQNSSSPIILDDLDDSIWFFGGSTTFGYGVADKETIPAKLENALKTKVVNFGRGYFYSAQENLLFRDYLKAGYRPKTAIFLDGVNERCDIEVYQEQMKSIFEEASEYSWEFSDAVYPVTKLSDKLITKLGLKNMHVNSGNTHIELHDLSCTSYGRTQPLTDVLQQNLLERQSICARFSVKCITYVQPFAGVHGIHSDQKTYNASDRKMMREKFTYLQSTWADSGSIFITDALETLNKHAYVDDCHYSAEASELIAKKIAKNLTANSPRKGLLNLGQNQGDGLSQMNSKSHPREPKHQELDKTP